jgi:hypothetical protein
MEILSKNILLQQALKNQNSWLIKFDLKKFADISNTRYNQLVVPEMIKIFPENVLSEAEIRIIYQEEFVIKKFEKYQDAIEIWKDVPTVKKIVENKIASEYFMIYCSLLNKEGLEVKNNKK